MSDHDVELMREMHEEYPRAHKGHLGYRRLADIFGCHRNTARKICLYLNR